MHSLVVHMSSIHDFDDTPLSSPPIEGGEERAHGAEEKGAEEVLAVRIDVIALTNNGSVSRTVCEDDPISPSMRP